jgi:hypothetical protein
MIYKTLHRNPKNKREIKQKRKSSVYIPETKATQTTNQNVFFLSFNPPPPPLIGKKYENSKLIVTKHDFKKMDTNMYYLIYLRKYIDQSYLLF